MPFASWPSAAVQLHQTGHSSTLQHFRRVKVSRADEAAKQGHRHNVRSWDVAHAFFPATGFSGKRHHHR